MLYVRPATLADLPQIMQIEKEQYAPIDATAMATEELMRHRIELLNAKGPGWFLVAENEQQLLGYLILFPTWKRPEDVQSWDETTDHGQLTATFSESGPHLYGVSFAVRKDAPDATSPMLILKGHELWERYLIGRFFMCSRMPGYAAAFARKGISAKEYAFSRKHNGEHKDGLVALFEEITGARVERLLENGYPPDAESGGHGLLMVSQKPYPQIGKLRLYVSQLGEDVSSDAATLDEQAAMLIGGREQIWHVPSRTHQDTLTLYAPFGCPDWGTKGKLGERVQDHCRFCALPSGPDFFSSLYYKHKPVSTDMHVKLFMKAWEQATSERKPHTLRLFNGGSFLAMPWQYQQAVIEAARGLDTLVVEARPQLMTDASLSRLMNDVGTHVQNVVIRIGVETQDDQLRNSVLGKGQPRMEIMRATQRAHKHGIRLGGYVMLRPAPNLDSAWAVNEAIKTIHWMLKDLGFLEAYFGATCVSEGSPLHKDWKENRFDPPSLHDVRRVLKGIDPAVLHAAHLLPFKDFPSFVAVPSNHVTHGIPESLEGAQKCDLAFHQMFEEYRRTMRPELLDRVPTCDCT